MLVLIVIAVLSAVCCLQTYIIFVDLKIIKRLKTALDELTDKINHMPYLFAFETDRLIDELAKLDDEELTQ